MDSPRGFHPLRWRADDEELSVAGRRPMPLQVAMAVLTKPRASEAGQDPLSTSSGSVAEATSRAADDFEAAPMVLNGTGAIPDLADLLSDGDSETAETRSIMPLVVAMAVLSRAEAVRARRTARRAALGGG
mmetsp:Transcript_3019/g.7227  ORF Transcript_3019/g.7227 Transcript_3019/m.7227 type:complete len:131 (-) Transcript_3019:150-542(-)